MKNTFITSYEKDTLSIQINIHEGFDRTIGYFLFTLLLLPIGLVMSLVLLYGIFTGKLIHTSSVASITFIIFTLFFDFIGGTTLYYWLLSNFSKEKIVIDNRDRKITYSKLLFGRGKTKVFEYKSVSEIKAEAEPIIKRYEKVYPKCYMKSMEQKFRFGYFTSLAEGENLVGMINSFIKHIN